MNRILLLLLGLSMLHVSAAGQQPNIAYRDDHVRFTVIADGAVRLEYAPDGAFVDDKSQVAVRREYPAVDYKIKKGAWIQISTSKLVLRYKKNSGPFSADNLSIRSAEGAKVAFDWKPGMRQQGNLKGTFRTLDGMEGDLQTFDWLCDSRQGERLPIEEGLLATDGWTLIDDSRRLLFDGDPEWDWVKPRPDNGGQDWYFLSYGHDYKAALRDFTLFAGKMPLPPRYAFGYWWSRNWAYSDRETRQLIDNFEAYRIPLDVLVIDMDWHYTDSREGWSGWTGWTWNRRLFPDPQRLLRELHERGLHVTLNLHPCDGVPWFERGYEEICRDLEIDPARKQTLPWVHSDKKYISSVFRHIINPSEREGVDFWWLDWQQYPNDTQIPELGSTWWLNYLFFSDMERNSQSRPLIFHRWGGLGNHRYPIGFSGDAIVSWKTLAYQPYFNATASNVLYGYWSHDLGGYFSFDHRLDRELYIRWMQFGALSPIMRSHSTNDPALAKEPWIFDHRTQRILRETIRLRYDLAPYVYTMARKAYDEGVALCRPLYYDYPDAPQAYEFRNQYLFGDDILVAPITAPSAGGYSTVEVWLPEGAWYEWQTGELLAGGRTVTRSFALDEYPVYVKAGSILPLHTAEAMNLHSNENPVAVTVFPGGDGSFVFYEDNGDDKHYAQEYATTRLRSSSDSTSLTVEIDARCGRYRQMPANRRYLVRVLASAAPQRVTCNGEPVEWSYDGHQLALEVALPETDCAQAKTLHVVYDGDPHLRCDGIPAKVRRIARAMEELKIRDAGRCFNDEFGPLGSFAEAVSYHPEQLAERLDAFRRSYSDLPAVLDRQGLDEANRNWMLETLNLK